MLDRQLLQLPGGKRMLAASIARALALGLLVVGQAAGLTWAIVGLWQGGALAAQAAWVALFCACFLLRRAVADAEDAMLERYAARTARELRGQLLEAVWDGGPALVRAHGSAAVAADAIEGADAVEEYVRIMFPKAANVVVVPLVILIAMFALDWVSGLISLACYPFILLFMRLIGQSAGAEARKRYAEFETLSASFTDMASGLETLRAFGASRRFAERVFALSERFRELTMKTLRIAMLSTTVLDLFATFGLAGVAIMLGFRLVDGTMQLFPALCVLMMVPEYFKPVREYGEDYHSTLNGKAALGAIAALLGAQTADEDGARAGAAAAADASVGAAAGQSTPEQALASLGLRPGVPGCAGVVGKSGAGKTTLLDRIAGLSGARDDAWAARVAYLPQEPYLFRTSLRDNVAFYAPDADDAQVRDALAAAGLGAFAASLPDGLDTRIGDGGRELSGGQAQRVAIARALLDPARDLWLLDEPTARLDAQTEAELIACMLPLMRDKTVVVATHSAAWLPHLATCFRIDEGHLAPVAPAEALR